MNTKVVIIYTNLCTFYWSYAYYNNFGKTFHNFI